MSSITDATKPQRIHSCISCQRRKVKCDRKFPCANCTRIGAQCTTASLAPRQRRRRFPERELLDQLSHYEDLLRKNNVAFEPLHKTPGPSNSDVNSASSHGSGAVQASDKGTLPCEKTPDGSTFKAKSFWHAMNRMDEHPDYENHESSQDEDDSDSIACVLPQVRVKNAWNQIYLHNDHLLFCGRNTGVNLTALHPSQADIFKLWQLYLDNVSPLLKITHTPSLQKLIIDAAGDVASIDPPLEALMFSIYSVAVFSLNQADCQSLFGTPREDVMRGFQLGTREALVKCEFLKSSSRDCLTALHLYLITLKPDTDPRALSSLLGSAVRIAQRMGIHNEASNAKYSLIEAEMRRRLWWSLVLFDARIAEMTDLKYSSLIPTWDCKVPLNVNDFDLRAGMKQLPPLYTQPTEALFAVVRAEIGAAVQHDSSHLDFINPALKPIARNSFSNTTGTTGLGALESMIEFKYLKNCDLEIPIHYMTTWVTRVALAKARFVQHLANSAAMEPQDAQRDAVVAHAQRMLECDTQLMRSPLTEGYRWFIYLHFPFPAYVHLVEDLKKRPLGDHSIETWRLMEENYTARFMGCLDQDNPMNKPKNPFVEIFAAIILQAWSAREKALGHSEEPPLIVTQIKQRAGNVRTATTAATSQSQTHHHDHENMGNNTLDPTGFGNFDSLLLDDDMRGNSSSGVYFPGQLPTLTSLSHTPWVWPDSNWDLTSGSW